MASALAVTLSILLLVVMLAQYLDTAFPQQMQTQEYLHTLQVENQFLSLQNAIQEEVNAGKVGVVVDSPLALSGSGVPPFGPPSGSTVQAIVPNTSNVTAGISIASSALAVPELTEAGLTDTINNAYIGSVTLEYEEGAVVTGTPSGSTMLEGPAISVVKTSTGGWAVTMSVVQFLPVNTTEQSGGGVMGVQTWLFSEASSTYLPPGSLTTGNQYLNVSTPYPTAWQSWAEGYSTIIPSTPTITSCHSPSPTQRVCTVHITMVDASLALTVASVGIRFTG